MKRTNSLRSKLVQGWGLIVLIPCSLFALDPANSIYQYNCRNWTRQSGLPVNGISAITQSKDGYLWLGTQKGLVRFSGVEFTAVNLPNSPQFRRQTIGSLASSSKGGVWFGISGGAFGFFDGQERFSSMEKESWVDPLMNVGALREADDGTLWVGTGKGTARWSRGNTNETSFFEQLWDVTAIHEDARHRVWLGTSERGMYYWQDGKINSFIDPALKGQTIFAITTDSNGRLWVGTQWGLRSYDSNLRPTTIVSLTTEVRALLTDRHGAVWIGTSGDGLVRFQNEQASFLRKTNGLAHDFVTALLEDQEGSLWVGTRDGLSQLSDVKFPVFAEGEGLIGGFCHSVSAAANGGLWMATTRGLSWFDGKSVTNISMEAGLSIPYIKRVYQARNGEVYLINGNREVEILSQGKVVARYANTNWPTAIAEDSEGVVVAVGGDLFRASRKGFVPCRYNDGDPGLYWVRNLFSGSDGSLLVASVNGVFRLKQGSVQHWTAEEGLSDNNVLWVCEDNNGTIWAGLTTGIARISGNRICNITRNDGLSDNFVSAIVPDDRGDLWMYSGRGILRASQQNLTDFAEGKVQQVECSVYDGLESLKTIDTTDVEATGCKTAGGRIWFPCPQGAIMIDPANIRANPVAPPVHIQRLRINGTRFTAAAHPVIQPGRGELEFEYTALSYIAPQKVQFRYRLEGYDPEWVDAGSRRSAFYTNLKPGKYRFHVQAANADGVWNTAGDNFEVELPPHIFQTAAFQATAGLMAAAALLGVYLWRVRHLQHKHQRLQDANEVLESKIRERTAELAQQRNMLRILIDHLPDNIFVKDMQSRIVLDNLAHARNLGAENPDAVVGKSDFDFFPKELAESFYAAEQELLKGGEVFNGEEVSLNRATGQPRWTRTTKVALRDSQGKIIGLAGINRDITERKQWEAKLESLHKQLVDASRHAGMAEVATSVLHNVGNVLNSVNVAASVVEDKVQNSSDTKLARVMALLHEHKKDLAHFLTHHEKGRQILGFLDLLVEHLSQEKVDILKEMKGLVRNIEHIKEIVAMQQTYAKVAGVEEVVTAPELVEDALRMHLAAYQRHSVQLVREFSVAPALSVDRHKVIQILVNLLQNAKYACDAKQSHDRKVTVRVGPAAGERVRIEVEDNGIGIPVENLTRIFSHGFTTRKDGHGYGLHSGAIAAKEMGGELTARSPGPGQGASFVLELPARFRTDSHLTPDT